MKFSGPDYRCFRRSRGIKREYSFSDPVGSALAWRNLPERQCFHLAPRL
jgi:hypothetical protein